MRSIAGWATSGPKSMEMHAVKILADGTRIPLGCIGRWHRNPCIRAAWAVQDAFSAAFRRLKEICRG